MKNFQLRFRQIHLDFHTSEQIEGIGEKFDPEEFASTLERAGVDSITCFARGHHGYIYYDTKAFPERRHPHMKTPLLERQIKACHAKDIRVPIYITVQWDHYTAEHHPEWLVVTDKGCLSGTPPYEPGFYRTLCVNTPYVDFLKAQTREVLETLPTDGLFFDIVNPQDCSCHYCRQGMLERGLEPSEPENRQAYALEVLNGFMRDMTQFVRKFNKDCTIFYNSGHIAPRHREMTDAFTHFELESLPSGGWGYAHFPITMRYARNLGLDCMGMTGKFHTTWGDFHSFKNQEALEFECFRSLALGAKCSIGDQLPPDGKICQTTYDLIGSVYSQVKAKEPWCNATTAMSDIGILIPEKTHGRMNASMRGVTRILEEGQQQFEIIDSKEEFDRFKVLILPDEIPVDTKQMEKKLEKFIAGGGGLIATHRSGLDESGTDFALKPLGISFIGDAPYSPDFILPKGPIGEGLPKTEHVMYLQGMQVQPGVGTEILADTIVPYFNRTYSHFCSHNHTPSSGQTGCPGITRNGSCIYFMHPIFKQYDQSAPKWCKTLLHNALAMLLPRPLVKVAGPSTVLAALNSQIHQKRFVLHLLHYIPERRSQQFETIEDVIPLYDLPVSLRIDEKIRAITLVPEIEELSFNQDKDIIEMTVPKVVGHQMIELKF